MTEHNLRTLVRLLAAWCSLTMLAACGGGGGSGSGPNSVSLVITGEVETVFDWSLDRCEDNDFPDLPVRAFRDATGRIQMVSGHAPRYYRWTGDSLDSLARDCTSPVLVSGLDKDPARYDFKEWIGALYTFDGTTIHALIHSEFHGWEASDWHAEFDFSDSQGVNDWYYQQSDGTTITDMDYMPAGNHWEGLHEFCKLRIRTANPGPGCDAIRTWISPVDATVTVTGEVYDLDDSGGDGVHVEIAKGSDVQWALTLDNGDTDPRRFDLDVDVNVGDRLHFRVNERGDADFDSTYFNPEINIGPDPCPSDERGVGDCLWVSLTQARSNDGGASYDHPEPLPDHVVANPPVRYEPDGGHHAIWQSSTIIRHPNDGYYYALLQRDQHPADDSIDVQGTCVMRTDTLNDPDSWRAWDGEGFNMRFPDPYRTTIPDPDRSWCEPVSPAGTGALTRNLSYNTFLEQFVVVGTTLAGPSGPGFYFSLSGNLVEWSAPRLIMEVETRQTAAPGEPFLAYPTLIDPDDSSRNFERPGKRAYLYYTRFNRDAPTDNDLVRVPVEFMIDD